MERHALALGLRERAAHTNHQPHLALGHTNHQPHLAMGLRSRAAHTNDNHQPQGRCVRLRVLPTGALKHLLRGLACPDALLAILRTCWGSSPVQSRPPL